VLDGAALLAGLGPRAAAVQQPAVDARFDLSSGAPVVVPSADGRTLEPAGLAAAVSPVLLAPAPRTAVVPLAVTPPALTTERAAGLGVTEVIGTYTTKHPCCRGRVKNIQTMADIVEGHLVLPGETYSLNERVGVRDRARGFVPAPMILEGQFVDAVGGGVSQFATTMYNATFFAGLEDVEHKPHSYYITRYPEGREATISSPAPDLRWRNDSPHAVLVDTSYTGTSITVTLWGTKRYDEVVSLSSGRSRIRSFGTEYVTRSDCTASPGMVGFDITITRVMKKGGAEVARDSYSHRYTPEPRFICGPPPAPRPSAPRPTPPPAAVAPAPVAPAPVAPVAAAVAAPAAG
jgi:vancomycin resistance protein YoaR